MTLECWKSNLKFTNATLAFKRAILSLRCVSQDQATIWIEQCAVKKNVKTARLVIARNIGIIKTLGYKNVAKELLNKSFSTLLSRNMLEQRRCMSWSSKR